MTNANDTQGSKYLATRELDIAEIAKLVRADIAAAIKAGELPKGLKCAVKIQRYAGVQSLSVIVKAFPGQVDSDALIAWRAAAVGECPPAAERMTPAALATRETLVAIRDAYNYDRSDCMSDYYNVRFYGEVSFASDAAQGPATAADKAFEARAKAKALDAQIAAQEARIAELETARREAAKRAEQARIERDAVVAEMAATAGYFLGNA